jgi:hypothetical protein
MSIGKGWTSMDRFLTNNHDGEVEALLDGLAVDLVGQVGESNISLQLLAEGAVGQRLIKELYKVVEC